MFDCCRCLFSSSPKVTLPAQEQGEGSHLAKPVIYRKIKILRETRFSQISKISIEGDMRVLKSAKSKEEAHYIEQEIYILRILNAAERGKSQKCVIDLIAVRRSGDKPSMILPFFQTDLHDRIVKEKRLSLQSTLKILGQMLKALAFLKEQNVFHRDIKPENIFIVKEDEIRLADFGLAMVKGDEERSKISCGTPTYQSPELLAAYIAGTFKNKPFDFPSDMWATACTVLETASGKDLFSVNSNTKGWGQELMSEQKTLSENLEERVSMIYEIQSDEKSVSIKLFQTTLRGMFEQDPTIRMTPEDGIDFFEGKTLSEVAG
jgi:serine/threonine protein kinase